MTAGCAAVQAHLDGGATTLARAWAITRRDGVVMGFTDHDCDLEFEGITFRAETGMTAQALSQTTGLAVDNSAAVGAVSADAITEEDIAAGRFDGAKLTIWMVNWADPGQRVALFSGGLGEVMRKGAAFEVELRGLAEALNQPQGRVFQARCSAVLGDGACRMHLAQPGYALEAVATGVSDGQSFRFAGLSGYEARWFENGRLDVLSGPACGLSGAIRADRAQDGDRVIELWAAIRAPVVAGDRLRLVAGCDKRAETCRLKFNNFINFRGFPHIPGEDWLLSYPKSSGTNNGGSLSG